MEYSNFFLMIFMVVEIIILLLLLKMDIFSNILKLRKMLDGRENFARHDHEYVSLISNKIKYYKVFMIYLYTYWVMEAIVLSLRPFMALYHQWIFTLLHQILILLSMSFLFLTLNYSIKSVRVDHEDRVVNIPLPFNP